MPTSRIPSLAMTLAIVLLYTNLPVVASQRGLVPGAWVATVRARGYVIASRSITVRASRLAEEVRVDLVRSATISGVVRDSRGQRMAGVRVWLGAASTQSDADGNFTLVGAPVGDATVQAELGTRQGSVSMRLAPGDDRANVSIEITD